MKKFNFQKDLRLSELKRGKVYNHNGITVFYAGEVWVTTFCDGTDRFSTVKCAKEFIKSILK